MGTGASIAGVGLEIIGTRFKGMFIKIRVFKHPKPKSCFDRGEGADNSGAQIYSSDDTLEAASGRFLGSLFPAYGLLENFCLDNYTRILGINDVELREEEESPFG